MSPTGFQLDVWNVNQSIILGPSIGPDLGFAPLITHSKGQTLSMVISELNSGSLSPLGDICTAFGCKTQSYYLLYRALVAREYVLQMLSQHLTASCVSYQELPDETSSALLSCNEDDSSKHGQRSSSTSEVLEGSGGELPKSMHLKLADVGNVWYEVSFGALPMPTFPLQKYGDYLPEFSTEFDRELWRGSTVEGEAVNELHKDTWDLGHCFALGAMKPDQGSWPTALILDPEQVRGIRTAVTMLNAGELNFHGNFVIAYSESSFSYYLLYKRGYKDMAMKMICDQYVKLSSKLCAWQTDSPFVV
jgi:hypothetical protein